MAFLSDGCSVGPTPTFRLREMTSRHDLARALTDSFLRHSLRSESASGGQRPLRACHDEGPEARCRTYCPPRPRCAAVSPRRFELRGLDPCTPSRNGRSVVARRAAGGSHHPAAVTDRCHTGRALCTGSEMSARRAADAVEHPDRPTVDEASRRMLSLGGVARRGVGLVCLARPSIEPAGRDA